MKNYFHEINISCRIFLCLVVSMLHCHLLGQDSIKENLEIETEVIDTVSVEKDTINHPRAVMYIMDGTVIGNLQAFKKVKIVYFKEKDQKSPSHHKKRKSVVKKTSSLISEKVSDLLCESKTKKPLNFFKKIPFQKTVIRRYKSNSALTNINEIIHSILDINFELPTINLVENFYEKKYFELEFNFRQKHFRNGLGIRPPPRYS